MPAVPTIDDIHKRLFRATKSEEQAAIIDEAITYGLLDARNRDGSTLLILAVYRLEKKIAQLLLDRGAQLEIRDNQGYTALDWALFRPYSRMTPFLISKGANIKGNLKFCEYHMMTSVELCFKDNRPDDAITLLERCIRVYPKLRSQAHSKLAQYYYTLSQNPKHTNSLNTQPPFDKALIHALSLDKAALNRKEKALQKAIIQSYLSTQPSAQAAIMDKAIADFLKAPYSSDPVLIRAAKERHKDLIKLLVNKKVDVNAKSVFNFTPLIWAALNGDIESVAFLLENGSDVTLQNNASQTALMWAAREGHTNIVELLLKYEKNINQRTNTGLTALMSAAHNGHTNTVELLLKKGANSNIQDYAESTALMFAAQKGYIKIVEILLKNKADANLKTKSGSTALMLAANNGHTNTVELLLKKGANSNIQDYAESTALIYAARKGYIKIVEILLKNKADANLKTKSGFTALMWAADNGYQEIAALLLNSPGLNLEEKDNKGNTALSWAIKNNRGPTIAFLISKSADISAHIEACEPFMIAAAQLCFKDNRPEDAIALLERCINLYPALAQELQAELAQYYYTLSKDLNHVTALDAAPPLDKALMHVLSLNPIKLNDKTKLLKYSITTAYLSKQPLELSKRILPILEYAHTNPTLAYETIQDFQRESNKLSYSTSKSKDAFIAPAEPTVIPQTKKKITRLQKAIQYLSQKLSIEKKQAIQEDKNANIESNFRLANNYLRNYNNPNYNSDEMITKALQACLAIPSTDENSFYYRFKEQIVNMYLADQAGNSPDSLPERILSLIKSSHTAPKLAFNILKIDKPLQAPENEVNAPNALHTPSIEKTDLAPKKPSTLLFSQVSPSKGEPNANQENIEPENLKKTTPKSPKTP